MADQFIGPQNNLAADATYQPSPAIWEDCPVAQLINRPGTGLYFHDNFQDLPLAPTLTTQIAFGKYKAFATSGDTINRITSINSVETQGGALKLAHNTDNNSASLGQAYRSYLLSNSRTTSGKLWFECCFAQNSIVTNLASTIIGLGETSAWTFATGVPLNGGDSPTNSGSFIGFQIKEDGLGVIDTVVSDRATSFTTIGTGEGGTLAAYTFRKLGFVYDPFAAAADRIIFYANNQKLATRYTDTNLAATTNLKANSLGLMIASVADSAGTSFEGYMKWWRVAQLTPAGV